MLEWWKEASGWALLMGDCKAEVEPGLEAYSDLARAETCRPSYATGWRGEADQFWSSAEEAARARCCKDLPATDYFAGPGQPSKYSANVDPVDLEFHAEGLKLSLLALVELSRVAAATAS